MTYSKPAQHTMTSTRKNGTQGSDLPTKAPRLYKIEDTGYDGTVKNSSDDKEVNEKKGQAIIRSFEWGDKIPIGIFYRCEEPTFEDLIANRMPAYKQIPLVKQRHLRQGRYFTLQIPNLISSSSFTLLFSFLPCTPGVVIA